MISHDLPMVSEFADRVAVMYCGRLVESGSVDEIFPRSSHPYTRALADCLPNLKYQPELPSIPGAPPNPSEELPGCAFAPRCTLVEPECREALPPQVALSETHWATCIKAK